jgi:hypothetical protein
MVFFARVNRAPKVAECFADDTAIYSIGATIQEATQKRNRELGKATEWFARNYLQLNEKKCVAMFISHQNGKKKCDAGQVMLGKQQMKIVSSVKYLGVTVDRSLTWSEHFKNVKRNVGGGIHMINRLKAGLPVEERVGLYHALVEPHLTYCAPVWADTTKKLRETLRVAQNHSIRAISNYDTTKKLDKLYGKFRIQKVEDRWRSLDAVWLYRILKSETSVPDYLKDLISFTERKYNTRSKDRIAASCSTAFGQRMFAWRLKELYRDLPGSLWEASSLEVFKQRISDFSS